MNQIIIGLLVLSYVWLFIISVLYILSIRHYKALKIKNGQDLGVVLSNVLRRIASVENENSHVIKSISEIKKELSTTISRYHLLRFNPFGDNGGDLSFVLSLLNNQGDGFVITSLHGRSGTRVYSKSVKNSKKDIYELSKEETDAINFAMKG